jgi:hypothetical protein
VPPTLDLPPTPEPPAVVNLLTHGFRVTADAVPATLLDLAARGVVTLQHRGPDVFVCRLGAVPDGLTSYEQRVVALLRERTASDGFVPPGALTTGPEQEAKGWRRAFQGEVVADARRRGLCRPIADAKLVGLLFLGLLGPGVLWWHRSSAVGIAFVAAGALVLAGILGRHTQRETPEGLASASRWLGVRQALRQDEVFSTLPPITVGLWKRYLAYGAALGVAPGAVRPIPIGAESDTRAWSDYGGHWRAVRVEYPNAFPLGWGLSPLAAFVGAGFAAVFSGFLVAVFAGPVASASVGAALPFLAVGSVALLVALIVFCRAIADLFGSPLTVRGEILRLRVYGDKNKRRYVGVDDGTAPRIRAFVVEPMLYRLLEQGELVDVTVTRHLRHVREIEEAARVG